MVFYLLLWIQDESIVTFLLYASPERSKIQIIKNGTSAKEPFVFLLKFHRRQTAQQAVHCTKSREF